MTTKQTALWTAVIGSVGAIVGNSLPPLIQRIISQPQPIIRIQGAIMKADVSPARRHPVKDVKVEYETGGKSGNFAETDSNGLFTLEMGKDVKPGDLLTLRFRRSCYEDFDETIAVANVVFTRYLWAKTSTKCDDPTIVSINVTSRYVEKTFEIANQGTVPCRNSPCSPDAKWQARDASASLNAGNSDTFVNASAVCVAGPCPFTKIVEDAFSKGGQQIGVSVRNWSDTVTYVLRGELSGPKPIPVTVRGRSFDFTVYETKRELGHQVINAKTSEGEQFELPWYKIGFLSAGWAKCSSSEFSPLSPGIAIVHCKLSAGYDFSPQLQILNKMPQPKLDVGVAR